MAEVTQKNVWMNGVSAKMIHNSKDGTFYNVSFDYPASETGVASVSVRKGQVKDATRKDKTIIEGKKNVLLGAPGTKRKISVKQNGDWVQVEVTVEDILKSFTDGRDAYNAKMKEAADAGQAPETPAEETVEATKTTKKGGRKATSKKSK